MPQTKTFGVDNLGFVAITAKSICQSIEIMENNQAGTADYIVAAPTNGDDQVTRPAGSRTQFTPGVYNHFSVGQTIGYVKMAAVASVTFDQIEN